MSFVFDPKIFILPPFLDCPKCGEKNCYGVLSIQAQHYIRRCKQCWGDEAYPLPLLNKKIIYIDQFAISNMMKSINPKLKVTNKHDSFFKDLFLKLEFLAKAHIVVCPHSLIHSDESIMSRNYEDIKAMYRYLSFGSEYMPVTTINRFHFVSAFEKYTNGNGVIEIDKKIVCPSYNIWKERFRIDIDQESIEEDKRGIKKYKLKASAALQQVFDNWRSEKPFDFEKIFKIELFAAAKLYVERYLSFIEEKAKAYMGMRSDLGKSDETIILVYQMLEILKSNGSENGITNDLIIIQNFLQSDALLEIPNHRIECLLWAALARKAAAGQKSLRNISIVNDIRAISSYMPYSDAMFIDKECHGLLNDGDVSKRLMCNTRIFSLANKEEFLDYLDDMISKVSPEHIELIKKVYGDTWLKPYTTMYNP